MYTTISNEGEDGEPSFSHIIGRSNSSTSTYSKWKRQKSDILMVPPDHDPDQKIELRLERDFIPAKLLTHLIVDFEEQIGNEGGSDNSSNMSAENQLGDLTKARCHRLETFRNILRRRQIPETWPGVAMVSSISSLCTEFDYDDSQKKDLDDITFVPNAGFHFSDNKEDICVIGIIEKYDSKMSFQFQEQCRQLNLSSRPWTNIRRQYSYGLAICDNTGSILLNLGTEHVEDLINFDIMASGVVCAVKGRCSNGELYVDDALFPTPYLPRMLSFSSQNTSPEMFFISALEFSSQDSESSIFHSLLLEYIQGLVGSPDEQTKIARKSRVFILGNSFSGIQRSTNTKSKELTTRMAAAARLDDFFDELSKSVEVIVLPGENDITAFSQPLPALNKDVFFPYASQNYSFQCFTSPARVASFPTSNENDTDTDNAFHILVSSGSELNEVFNCPNDDFPLSPIDTCKTLLEWGHLCPTANSISLDGFLNTDNAESVLTLTDRLPHIYAVGNQEKFDKMHWNSVNIVTIPKFSCTKEIVSYSHNTGFTCISFNTFLTTKKKQVHSGYNSNSSSYNSYCSDLSNV